MASWIGAGACAIAAALLIPFFSGSSLRHIIPLLFLLVIFLTASRFGRAAGIFGTIAAALLFAMFLFSPTLSPMVEDTSARDHLIWMVLIGIIASDLVGAYVIPGTHKRL